MIADPKVSRGPGTMLCIVSSSGDRILVAVVSGFIFRQQDMTFPC